jgi:quinoprotein glucose dehydrogenase
MRLLTLAALAGTIAATAAMGQAQNATPSHTDWPTIGGNPGNSHYSTLKQINRTNVAKLQLAWKFDSGEPGGLETTPIVIDGVLYAITPKQKIIALNAATGKLL